jgi:DNA repair exonuclease SbcCD ATPase subunit
MKVIRLTAENVKRLRAVQIEPDGNIVVIAGRNGQGKTSVLDSIWFALAGGDATKDTPKPIRNGEEEATVELDLGDFIVKRTWRGDKTTLSVMSKEGAKYPSPQKFLDEKLGALSFDPLEFSQMDDKKQLATLLDLVELPFDPWVLASRRDDVYAQRTEIGREIRAYEGQLAGLRDVPDDTPDEEVSGATILEQQDAHRAAVQGYDEAENELDRLANAISAEQDNVEECESQARLAKERLAEYVTQREAKAEAFEKRARPEIRDFREELEGVEDVNVMVRTKRARGAVQENMTAAKAKQKGLTEAIEAIDKEKSEALAAAAMPIEGLAFDDDGVTYGGVPFKQCSSAEQLRVSLAMAMALNPAIKVIRISDGSLLDSENMAIIAEMAQEHDFQCWIERVDETGAVGFVIEDGSVVESKAK